MAETEIFRSPWKMLSFNNHSNIHHLQKIFFRIGEVVILMASTFGKKRKYQSLSFVSKLNPFLMSGTWRCRQDQNSPIKNIQYYASQTFRPTILWNPSTKKGSAHCWQVLDSRSCGPRLEVTAISYQLLCGTDERLNGMLWSHCPRRPKTALAHRL